MYGHGPRLRLPVGEGVAAGSPGSWDPARVRVHPVPDGRRGGDCFRGAGPPEGSGRRKLRVSDLINYITLSRWTG